jgi:hypothetical protein
MSETFSFVLQACPEDSKEFVAQFLGKAFGLKDVTSVQIASSAPIALITGLTLEEAAAMTLLTAPLQLTTATVHFTAKAKLDIPKVDWPKRPLIYKREISEYVSNLALSLTCPDCGKKHELSRLLEMKLCETRTGTTTGFHKRSVPVGTESRSGQKPPTKSQFKGDQPMGEVTPIFNQALSPSAGPDRKSAKGGAKAAGDEGVARLNELFPDDESTNFVPDKSDVNDILNRLLPDEGGDAGAMPASGDSSGLAAVISAPTSGYSVFLAKIGDEARRAKAVAVLAELAKISTADAEALSKKVIIPVLKGVTKQDAEAAKQRFAKIGILARIKGAGA